MLGTQNNVRTEIITLIVMRRTILREDYAIGFHRLAKWNHKRSTTLTLDNPIDHTMAVCQDKCANCAGFRKNVSFAATVTSSSNAVIRDSNSNYTIYCTVYVCIVDQLTWNFVFYIFQFYRLKMVFFNFTVQYRLLTCLTALNQ